MDSEACFGLWINNGHEGIDSQPSNESLPSNVSAYCQCLAEGLLPRVIIWGTAAPLV
jgi:hypothetical protein